ncbi:hypothetical protein J6590_060076 [Homalodisca vitripennis]|nr:hypothetical protein J6590_060076 [Homalodisca vitripennis]
MVITIRGAAAVRGAGAMPRPAEWISRQMSQAHVSLDVSGHVDCAERIAACTEKARRPVCGTDNQTYPTRCHLLKQHCRQDGPNLVTVKHRGHCKERSCSNKLHPHAQYEIAHCVFNGECHKLLVSIRQPEYHRNHVLAAK